MWLLPVVTVAARSTREGGGRSRAEEAMELRRTKPQDAPVNDSQHSDVSPHRQWSQAEMKQGVGTRQIDGAQETRLNCIEGGEGGRRGMSNGRSTVFNKAQNVGFI
eukprot:3349056-Pyramimonas_sp.AAC.1